jgi:hypothetical protein
MTPLRLRIVAPSVLALMLALTPAARSAAAPPKAAAMHDDAMAEMMKYAMPGPGHAMLAGSVGDWDATVKMWMGPGEPMVTAGTSHNTMILGGRYLEQRYTGTMMGQPFHGYGLTGYDNRKQRYTTLWVDDSSTEMMAGTASWNDKEHTLTGMNETTGPDGKPMTSRTTTRRPDPDTEVFSMYADMGGKETLMMEITYRRTK